jgi:penicillin-binding protein 1A
MVRTILMGEKGSGGGSTSTQQLAKNLFPRDTTDYHWAIARKWALVKSKFKEWVIAVRLERNYTKKEILVMYLNTVPFGHQSYGIKSAAKTYFNTSPDSLKVEQAALLIGLLRDKQNSARS